MTSADGNNSPDTSSKAGVVGVVGLGYVGLPLALVFAESGLKVIGFDIDNVKVSALNAGRSYMLHIPASRISLSTGHGRFEATSDFSRVKSCSAIVLCVPTPLGKAKEPDLTAVLSTGRSVAPFLQYGTLVVLESTTYPGTTDTDLRGVLEAGSNLLAGVDFHLAYSPEREDPGNPESQVANIPKIVGGYTPACLDKAMALYRHAIKTLIPVRDCRVAEAVKLSENIFRAVNIALVNELKMVYAAMGLDIWEILAAAKTKPFGFMPFYPGPGWGGHCIPIDPFYLSWKARQHGQPTRFVELAGEINTAMPHYVVQRTRDALAGAGLKLHGSRILLLGLAYKANVDDDRESPAYRLWELFEAEGARVEYHDPHVPEIRPSREHRHLAGRASAPITPESVARFDVLVVVTAHQAVDRALIARHARLIVDTRNAFGGLEMDPSRYFKA